MSKKRQFRMVGSGLWQSAKFRNLSSDTDRMAYLYVITNKHCNSVGAYALPAEYMAGDLVVDITAARAILENLVQAGLIVYDTDERILMVSNWFEFNSIDSRKHLAGAFRSISDLPAQSIIATDVLLNVCLSILQRVQNWSSSQRQARVEVLEMVKAEIRDHLDKIGRDLFSQHVLNIQTKGIDKMLEYLEINGKDLV